jgi:hypothetical protein
MHYFKNDTGHVVAIEDRLWVHVLRNERNIVETDISGNPLNLDDLMPEPLVIDDLIEGRVIRKETKPDKPRETFFNQLESLKEETVAKPKRRRNVATRVNG